MKKTYKEIIVTAQPFNPEILSSVLWELNIEGIQEDVNCLRIFAGEGSAVTSEDVKKILQRLKSENLVTEFNAEENIIGNKNWNEEWEKTINVIHVSEKIVIKPTFREYTPEEDQLVITIDPKMSFGTGEHQTTKLVLSLLEKYVTPGMKMLDVGSGTGVLAIASILLGADTAVAVDKDEWCLDNANENAVLNKVNDKIQIITGEIKVVEQNDFNLIAANIQKNILLQIAGEIYNRIANNGIVILSGLLDADEKDIISKYTEVGLSFNEKQQMDEWIALVFSRE